MTNISVPSRKGPKLGRSLLNDLLAWTLIGLVLLAWVLSWRGTLSGAWPHVLETQSGTFSYVLLALTATLGPLIGTRFLPEWLSAGMKTGWHGVLAGFALSLRARRSPKSLPVTLAAALTSTPTTLPSRASSTASTSAPPAVR